MRNQNYKTPVQHLDTISDAVRGLIVVSGQIEDFEDETDVPYTQRDSAYAKLEQEQIEAIKDITKLVADAEDAGVFERAIELLAIEIAGRP